MKIHNDSLICYYKRSQVMQAHATHFEPQGQLYAFIGSIKLQIEK